MNHTLKPEIDFLKIIVLELKDKLRKLIMGMIIPVENDITVQRRLFNNWACS